MRLLLTSAGITNTSLKEALVDLLGKPIAESSALIIPTAIYSFPGGAGMAWRAICGAADGPLCGLGGKSLGVLELTALPSIADDAWIPTVRETDALPKPQLRAPAFRQGGESWAARRRQHWKVDR
jgi:dipeptidase E